MKAITDPQLELPFPGAGGPETAPRAAGGVPMGTGTARRSRWWPPGARCRAHSGPVPGHERPHLLPGRVHVLPQRARRALLAP